MAEERICWNCNYFFMPEGPDGFGACMLDEVFDPYMDEIYESGNFACCEELYRLRKYEGDKEACRDYEEAEIIHLTDDVDEDELFEELKNRNMDDILEKLHDKDWLQVKHAVWTLRNYIAFENQQAYEGLLHHYNGLPAAESLEDANTRVEMVSTLARRQDQDMVLALVNELSRTQSNNTTRRLYTEIIKVLDSCPMELIRDPVVELLTEKKFAYRIKQRLEGLLKPRWEGWWHD